MQTPLGFFTSFFGMNNSLTGADWMTLDRQCLYMCKSSLHNPHLHRSGLNHEAQQSASLQQ